MIEAQNLAVVFAGGTDALANVSLSVHRGDFLSLIGPSGCSKTTILRAISDLVSPSAGSLAVNGQSPEQARRSRAYGYVFQAPALFPWRTVAGNVTLPLELMNIPRAERIARTAE